VFYFLLTGEDYFLVSTPADALSVAQDPTRRSVADSEALCSEVRDRPTVVQEIDRVLARATAFRPTDRVRTVAELQALITPVLAS
jgi:hypothetical protein